MNSSPSLTSPPLTIHDTGAGAPVLLLHGGAGPRSVIPFAERLGSGRRIRTIVPTHPGFSGTPRPERMRTPADLAQRYDELLDELGLDDVTVVGFSLGGWVAAELATHENPRVGRVVVVDGVGIVADGEPITDVSGMAPTQISAMSYHDPSLAPNPAQLTEAQRAEAIANVQAVVSYGGAMADPGLTARLASVRVPALIVWGESDGIAGPAYGRAYARAFADARFELLRHAGHMPQIEQPDALAAALLEFIGAV